MPLNIYTSDISNLDHVSALHRCHHQTSKRQRTILRVLLRGLPDDGIKKVPKHVADLLASDVDIIWCLQN